MIVGDFITDVVVNDEVILELKAVQMLNTIHEVQLVNYLNATGKDTGLLMNFGSRSLEFKRKYRRPKQDSSPMPSLSLLGVLSFWFCKLTSLA